MQGISFNFKHKVIFRSLHYACWLVVILGLLPINVSFAKSENGNRPSGFSLPAQASANASGNAGELSDLNHDRTVDLQDLELFSSQYLSQDWETVNWCNFYVSSMSNEKFFRKNTANRTERFTRLLKFIADSYGCEHISQSVDKSDLDGNWDIDIADLTIFGSNYLETYWETVDWCQFHESTLNGSTFEGRRTKYYLQHFSAMLRLINDQFNCGGPEPPEVDILLENEPRYLARLAGSSYLTTNFYISDPLVGSVFIYDENLLLKAEIKGLSRPLGVAVDSQGNVLVGNDGRDNIEVYDPQSGRLIAVFGQGQVIMPTAITLDALGNIYVTDSLSHNVKVFDAAYNLIRTIGSVGYADNELTFPIDTAIDEIAGEVLIADQGNKRIQIYDLEGNWLGSITFDGIPAQNCRFDWRTWGYTCEIPATSGFTTLQAIEIDSLGVLHVLDNFGASVSLFDPTDGAYLGSYGQYGEGPGYLRLPMDLLTNESNTSLVLTGDADRIETFTAPWQ